MGSFIVAIYVGIIIAIVIIFLLVFKYYKAPNPVNNTAKSIDYVAEIKAILKDPLKSGIQIHDAMYQYIALKDLTNASKQQMNEALHVLLLYLKHHNCDAKLFANVLHDLEKRYPDYKYQIEAIGDQALVERKRSDRKNR